METIVRKASKDDVKEIARIHQEAFKEFFLTSLGEGFLKLYYSTLIDNEKSVVYCAVKDDKIVGFSATSYVSRGFNSDLVKKNLCKYGLEAIRLLFIKPKTLVRLARNMNKERKDTSIADDGRYAELYSIAVSPSCQGEGIGRLLLNMTETDIREHNNQISLTTDYYNNDKTIAFYRALGYEEFYDFVAYPKRRMWRMIKTLE